ncbi:TPA: hypothetical protein ACT2HZ_001312 [Streptococcus suis]
MGKKRYKKDDGLGSILALFIVLGILINFWYIILPLGLVYLYVKNRPAVHRMLNRSSIQRLENLVWSISAGFSKHQQLLSENGEDKAVLQLRGRLLAELFELDQVYQKVGKYLDAYKSKEVVDTLQLKYQLKLPEKSAEPIKEAEPFVQAKQELTEQEWIADLTPEILETYCNIQRDHLVILEKLEATTDKKEELTAIHEANMQRFQDILQGYMKIKQSPKDYFNAEERLAQAKSAMETFDSDLDNTIRQFNEADMQDFEVSLRMMKRDKKVEE